MRAHYRFGEAESQQTSISALDRICDVELCSQTDRIQTRTNDNDQVIRNSQLLLSLISSLLLIGVGLIGFGKKTGLTATM